MQLSQLCMTDLVSGCFFSDPGMCNPARLQSLWRCNTLGPHQTPMQCQHEGLQQPADTAALPYDVAKGQCEVEREVEQ